MKTYLSTLFLALMAAITMHAQIPQNIDPGTGDGSVSMWGNPTYIIIVVLVIAFVLLGFWIRRRR